MIKNVQNNITYGKLFSAVEHIVTQQNPQINFLTFKRQKGEFVIEGEGNYSELIELSKFLKRGQHLFLIVNNEHVLSKSVNGKLDNQKAVHSAFPNLNVDEFYYESYQNESDTLVSICRKDYVDKIIQEYQNNKINIIGFSLGNIIASHILPYIDKSEIQTSNALLSINNQKITDFKNIENIQEQSYDINGLKIKNSSILGLAGILSYYTNQSLTQTNFSDKIALLQSNFKQKRIFDLSLKICLGFIFTLLLVNFLVFSNYQDKINVLTAEIAVNENSKEKFLDLKDKVDKKKKIVDEISNSTNSKVSSYLDKIGATVPKTVLLSQVHYQPLLKNIKKENKIKYDKDEIFVKGFASKGDDFSKWIASLEKEEWIQTITVLNYGTGKKNNTEFSFKISLRE